LNPRPCAPRRFSPSTHRQREFIDIGAAKLSRPFRPDNTVFVMITQGIGLAASALGWILVARWVTRVLLTARCPG
jgi:hypothetical protein